MADFRLTIRHGSRVRRESFATLDEAMDAVEGHVDRIRSERPLEEVSALRDYEPRQRVHARLELSVGGLLRGQEAGIDVMGDGSLVPYLGVVRKRRVTAERGQSPFDALREALSQPSR